MITYWTCSGATPARSSAALIAIAPSFVAGKSLREPSSRPIGVRAPATMTELTGQPPVLGPVSGWGSERGEAQALAGAADPGFDDREVSRPPRPRGAAGGLHRARRRQGLFGASFAGRPAALRRAATGHGRVPDQLRAPERRRRSAGRTCRAGRMIFA